MWQALVLSELVRLNIPLSTLRTQAPVNHLRIQKLLFVCSRNRCRSLTAEKMFEGSFLYQMRSVGTQPEARIVVTEGHIGWANIIFCMEKCHVSHLRRKFPEAMRDKQVVCLSIPDDYPFMDPALIEEFQGCLAPYVEVP